MSRRDAYIQEVESYAADTSYEPVDFDTWNKELDDLLDPVKLDENAEPVEMGATLVAPVVPKELRFRSQVQAKQFLTELGARERTDYSAPEGVDLGVHANAVLEGYRNRRAELIATEFTNANKPKVAIRHSIREDGEHGPNYRVDDTEDVADPADIHPDYQHTELPDALIRSYRDPEGVMQQAVNTVANLDEASLKAYGVSEEIQRRALDTAGEGRHVVFTRADPRTGRLVLDLQPTRDTLRLYYAELLRGQRGLPGAFELTKEQYDQLMVDAQAKADEKIRDLINKAPVGFYEDDAEARVREIAQFDVRNDPTGSPALWLTRLAETALTKESKITDFVAENILNPAARVILAKMAGYNPHGVYDGSLRYGDVAVQGNDENTMWGWASWATNDFLISSVLAAVPDPERPDLTDTIENFGSYEHLRRIYTEGYDPLTEDPWFLEKAVKYQARQLLGDWYDWTPLALHDEAVQAGDESDSLLRYPLRASVLTSRLAFNSPLLAAMIVSPAPTDTVVPLLGKVSKGASLAKTGLAKTLGYLTSDPVIEAVIDAPLRSSIARQRSMDLETVQSQVEAVIQNGGTIQEIMTKLDDLGFQQEANELRVVIGSMTSNAADHKRLADIQQEIELAEEALRAQLKPLDTPELQRVADLDPAERVLAMKNLTDQQKLDVNNYLAALAKKEVDDEIANQSIIAAKLEAERIKAAGAFDQFRLIAHEPDSGLKPGDIVKVVINGNETPVTLTNIVQDLDPKTGNKFYRYEYDNSGATGEALFSDLMLDDAQTKNWLERQRAVETQITSTERALKNSLASLQASLGKVLTESEMGVVNSHFGQVLGLHKKHLALNERRVEMQAAQAALTVAPLPQQTIDEGVTLVDKVIQGFQQTNQLAVAKVQQLQATVDALRVELEDIFGAGADFATANKWDPVAAKAKSESEAAALQVFTEADAALKSAQANVDAARAELEGIFGAGVDFKAANVLPPKTRKKALKEEQARRAKLIAAYDELNVVLDNAKTARQSALSALGGKVPQPWNLKAYAAEYKRRKQLIADYARAQRDLKSVKTGNPIVGPVAFDGDILKFIADVENVIKTINNYGNAAPKELREYLSRLKQAATPNLRDVAKGKKMAQALLEADGDLQKLADQIAIHQKAILGVGIKEEAVLRQIAAFFQRLGQAKKHVPETQLAALRNLMKELTAARDAQLALFKEARESGSNLKASQRAQVAALRRVGSSSTKVASVRDKLGRVETRLDRIRNAPTLIKSYFDSRIHAYRQAADVLADDRKLAAMLDETDRLRSREGQAELDAMNNVVPGGNSPFAHPLLVNKIVQELTSAAYDPRMSYAHRNLLSVRGLTHRVLSWQNWLRQKLERNYQQYNEIAPRIAHEMDKLKNMAQALNTDMAVLIRMAYSTDSRQPFLDYILGRAQAGQLGVQTTIEASGALVHTARVRAAEMLGHLPGIEDQVKAQQDKIYKNLWSMATSYVRNAHDKVLGIRRTAEHRNATRNNIKSFMSFISETKNALPPVGSSGKAPISDFLAEFFNSLVTNGDAVVRNEVLGELGKRAVRLYADLKKQSQQTAVVIAKLIEELDNAAKLPAGAALSATQRQAMADRVAQLQMDLEKSNDFLKAFEDGLAELNKLDGETDDGVMKFQDVVKTLVTDYEEYGTNAYNFFDVLISSKRGAAAVAKFYEGIANAGRTYDAILASYKNDLDTVDYIVNSDVPGLLAISRAFLPNGADSNPAAARMMHVAFEKMYNGATPEEVINALKTELASYPNAKGADESVTAYAFFTQGVVSLAFEHYASVVIRNSLGDGANSERFATALNLVVTGGHQRSLKDLPDIARTIREANFAELIWGTNTYHSRIQSEHLRNVLKSTNNDPENRLDEQVRRGELDFFEKLLGSALIDAQPNPALLDTLLEGFRTGRLNASPRQLHMYDQFYNSGRLEDILAHINGEQVADSSPIVIRQPDPKLLKVVNDLKAKRDAFDQLTQAEQAKVLAAASVNDLPDALKPAYGVRPKELVSYYEDSFKSVTLTLPEAANLMQDLFDSIVLQTRQHYLPPVLKSAVQRFSEPTIKEPRIRGPKTYTDWWDASHSWIRAIASHRVYGWMLPAYAVIAREAWGAAMNSYGAGVGIINSLRLSYGAMAAATPRLALPQNMSDAIGHSGIMRVLFGDTPDRLTQLMNARPGDVINGHSVSDLRAAMMSTGVSDVQYGDVVRGAATESYRIVNDPEYAKQRGISITMPYHRARALSGHLKAGIMDVLTAMRQAHWLHMVLDKGMDYDRAAAFTKDAHFDWNNAISPWVADFVNVMFSYGPYQYQAFQQGMRGYFGVGVDPLLKGEGVQRHYLPTTKRIILTSKYATGAMSDADSPEELEQERVRLPWLNDRLVSVAFHMSDRDRQFHEAINRRAYTHYQYSTPGVTALANFNLFGSALMFAMTLPAAYKPDTGEFNLPDMNGTMQTMEAIQDMTNIFGGMVADDLMGIPPERAAELVPVKAGWLPIYEFMDAIHTAMGNDSLIYRDESGIYVTRAIEFMGMQIPIMNLVTEALLVDVLRQTKSGGHRTNFNAAWAYALSTITGVNINKLNSEQELLRHHREVNKRLQTELSAVRRLTDE